ncbi:MAG: MBL fold metallo-hydrolase [Capsulimonadales bacterium]|nr:MBL fold metallo-hydrolase [Capsulimonadales bacterium]
MELTILGTAAAEAWPAPFCLCAPCQEARKRGGPNIRFRSGALIDDDLKIDFGPDTVAQMLKTGRHLAHLRTLLFTHQHSDHLVPTELTWASGVYTNTPPPQPIVVFGNEAVLGAIRERFGEELSESNLDLREPLRPFVPIRTPTGDTVLPLPADHGAPGSLLFRITRADGTSLFFGHDSGLFPDETLDALEKEPPLDIVVFDCTYGGRPSSNRGHMGVDGVIRMADEVRRRGIANANARLVATHFSHNGGLLHEELVTAFLPHRIEVAFDGIVIRV